MKSLALVIWTITLVVIASAPFFVLGAIYFYVRLGWLAGIDLSDQLTDKLHEISRWELKRRK